MLPSISTIVASGLSIFSSIPTVTTEDLLNRDMNCEFYSDLENVTYIFLSFALILK